jgi:hypothetical protein
MLPQHRRVLRLEYCSIVNILAWKGLSIRLADKRARERSLVLIGAPESAQKNRVISEFIWGSKSDIESDRGGTRLVH